MARNVVRAYRAAVKQVGARGSVLLVFAWLDVLVAWGLFTIPPGARSAYSGAELVMPLCTWAWVWLAVAGLLFVQSFMKRDAIGFGVAIGIKILWGSTLIVSWAVYDIDRMWTLGSLYFAFALLVLTNARRLRDSDSSDPRLSSLVGVAPLHDTAHGRWDLGILPGQDEGPLRELTEDGGSEHPGSS